MQQQMARYGIKTSGVSRFLRKDFTGYTHYGVSFFQYLKLD